MCYELDLLFNIFQMNFIDGLVEETPPTPLDDQSDIAPSADATLVSSLRRGRTRHLSSPAASTSGSETSFYIPAGKSAMPSTLTTLAANTPSKKQRKTANSSTTKRNTRVKRKKKSSVGTRSKPTRSKVLQKKKKKKSTRRLSKRKTPTKGVKKVSSAKRLLRRVRGAFGKGLKAITNKDFHHLKRQISSVAKLVSKVQ